MTTASLAAALRACAAGLRPLEAGVGLLIAHGAFLHRDDFTRHIHAEPSIPDGTPMAWIDWDAVITALDAGCLPSSGGEKHILRITASLAVGHPVSLRDAISGLDQHNARLVITAFQHAAGQQGQLPVCPETETTALAIKQ